MRRAIGIALAGLGAFLLVAALMMRTYVGGQLIKFPLNEYVKTTLIAKNAAYFSPALVRSVTGATIQVTDTVKGDAKAGNSTTAVWNEFTYLYDLTNHKEYAVSTRRAAFNRRTSMLVDCCGASINGNSTIRQTGVSGYVFPLGTQKQTYDVFDTNVNRAMPFHYAGTGTIDGIPVYRFTERVTSVKAGGPRLDGPDRAALVPGLRPADHGAGRRRASHRRDRAGPDEARRAARGGRRRGYRARTRPSGLASAFLALVLAVLRSSRCLVALQDQEQVPGEELACDRHPQQRPGPARQVPGHRVDDGHVRC